MGPKMSKPSPQPSSSSSEPAENLQAQITDGQPASPEQLSFSKKLSKELGLAKDKPSSLQPLPFSTDSAERLEPIDSKPASPRPQSVSIEPAENLGPTHDKPASRQPPSPSPRPSKRLKLADDKPASPQLPRFTIEPAEAFELTGECHHYEGKHEVPWDIQKYFAQRYDLFSWYDEGVYMTDDAWFGVTPEPVANRVADDMWEYEEKKKTLIDMFAGAGGNTIAFALSGRWERVIAVEKDASTLACAQHNAGLYEVEPGVITWVHGDSLEYLDTLKHRPTDLHPDLRVDVDTTVVFASPPWGGPGYRTAQIFNLHTMQPYNLRQLHEACLPMDHALYLPRTSDVRQLAKLAPKGQKIDMIQYCMWGASKALVAYIPVEPSEASSS